MITGLIFKLDEKFKFINFFDEKIENAPEYFSRKLNKESFFKNNVILLVNANDIYDIKPVVMVALKDKQNNPIMLNKLSLDDLIMSAYSCAENYIKLAR